MEKILKLKNYEFNYYSKGKSTNLPILFLHGFLGDCNEFSEAISLLSNDLYCLAIDLPGHGKTKVNGGEELYQMEYIAQGLIEFLDALCISSCILMGYSMGGRVALYMALHFPQHFQKIILESASPGLKTQDDRNIRIQNDFHLAKEIETENFLAFLNKWYAQPLFLSIKNHRNFAKILERRLQNNPLELSKSLRNLSIGIQPSLWKKLHKNSVPLLLVAGQLDEKFININIEISSLCKFTQLEIVKDSGHNTHLENVGLFVQIIRKFLGFFDE